MDDSFTSREAVAFTTEYFLSRFPNGMTKSDVLEFQSDFTEENIDMLFNAIDLDGNGVVSSDEFLLWKLALSSPESAAKFFFHVWDTDHTGFLQFSHIVHMFVILKSAGAISSTKDPNTLARELFAKVDINHDGQISEDEFLAAMAVLHDMDEADQDYYKRIVEIL